MVEVELEEIHLKFSPLNSNKVDVRILKRDPGEHIEMIQPIYIMKLDMLI